MSSGKDDNSKNYVQYSFTNAEYNKQRLFMVLAIIFSISAAGLAYGGWSMLRSLEAETIAENAQKSLNSGNFSDAYDKMLKAYGIDPENEMVLRTSANVQMVTRPSKAIKFLKELISTHNAKTEDRLKLASLAMQVGDFETASAQIQFFKKHDIKEFSYIEIDYHFYLGNVSTALDAFHQALKNDNIPPEHLDGLYKKAKLEASPTQLKKLIDHFYQLGHKQNQSGIEALRILSKETSLSKTHRQDIANKTSKHPHATKNDLLNSYRLDVLTKKTSIETAISLARNKLDIEKRNELVLFNQWLASIKAYQVLDKTTSIEDALSHPQLLLSKLEAMAELNKWSEIRESFNSSNNPNLAFYEHLLASHFLKSQNQNKKALAEWELTLIHAKNDPEKLRKAFQYSKNRDWKKEASLTLSTLSNSRIERRKAYQEWIEFERNNKRAIELWSVYQKFSQLYPKEYYPSYHYQYLSLLLDRPLSDLETSGRPPARHKMIDAFTLLKEDKSSSALDALMQIKEFDSLSFDTSKLGSKERIMAAAILLANKRSQEAQKVIAQIQTSELLLEEKALLQIN